MVQNFYPGIGLFLGSQQRETGQLVSVGQFFSHTATLHIREGTCMHRKPLSTQRERGGERESEIKTTPANSYGRIYVRSAHEHMQLKASIFAGWIVLKRHLSICELGGQNVTTGPEISEGNERTVRATTT